MSWSTVLVFCEVIIIIMRRGPRMNSVLGCLHQSIFGQFPRLQISWLYLPEHNHPTNAKVFPLAFRSLVVVVRAASKSSATLSLPPGGRILFITGINGIWRIDVYHVRTVRPNNSVNNPKSKPIQAQEFHQRLTCQICSLTFSGLDTLVRKDRSFEFICSH